MAEWSNAAVLKTVDLRGSGGSNPSLSAKVSRCLRNLRKQRKQCISNKKGFQRNPFLLSALTGISLTSDTDDFRLYGAAA